MLALLWAHAAWLCAFPHARPCPQPGGSPDASPCRAGCAEAGGWQRCFAQHVQYNLYLFPAGVAFPVTFPTKPFAGGSPTAPPSPVPLRLSAHAGRAASLPPRSRGERVPGGEASSCNRPRET